jgi:dTDP-4-amino-4,6-dideoxygalactose transaminase
MVKMIPLYKPFMPEVPLIGEILHSGKLAYGEHGRKFEKSLGNFIGNENVLATNTFNMAILVALSTLEIIAGDTVIVSPMACLASTQPLLSMGIKVQWADVDPKTGTLCPDSVRSFIHKKPKAIIHNHYCGYPGHIDEINAIGKEFNIPVIDDGIESFGSEYKGKKMGNLGTDITVFSFNPVRIPNTIDGGAVVFDDKSLYEKGILVRDAGIDRKNFRDENGEINPDCDITLVGHSATIGEVNSYIGTQQMKNVEELITRQRNNAFRWDNFLKNRSDIHILNSSKSSPNYWVYGILTDNKEKVLNEFRSKGYYASGVHINNNNYSVFGDSTPLKGVNQFYNTFLAIPSGWWFTH